jgi:hypothetical protein
VPRYKTFCDSLSSIELHSLFPVLPALVDAAMRPNVGVTSLALSPEAVQGRVEEDGQGVTSTGRGYGARLSHTLTPTAPRYRVPANFA